MPELIVVCGAPASGKTTLARRLAAELRVPLLEKDVIKESLAEVLSTPDRDASRRIGGASTKLLYDIAHATLERNVDTMIEGNFDPQFAVRDLERMSRVGRVHVIQCEAARDIIVERYRQRHASGQRHAAHFDLDALPDLIAGLESGRYDLAGLGYPVLAVDTARGYRPGYEAIVDILRATLDEGPPPATIDP